MNVDAAQDSQSQALLRLGAQYGRTYGALTASGASALEAALRHLGVTAGTEVILPDTGCYKIGAAVLREGAVPVFTAVGPGLVLSADAVAAAVTSRTRCVVAVHQYGLPCPVTDLRTALPDGVRIVEDAAQSWDTLAEGRPVGRDGDVVVASFGRTKPVPLGAGGAVLGDEPGLADLMASDSPSHRNLAVPGTTAPFPLPLAGDLLPLLASAGALPRSRREFVTALAPLFRDGRYTLPFLRQGDLPSWHRVPVRCATELHRDHLLAAAGHASLRAQPEHPVRLPDLPMFRDRCRTVNRPGPAGADDRAQGPLVVLQPDGDLAQARQLGAALLRGCHLTDRNLNS